MPSIYFGNGVACSTTAKIPWINFDYFTSRFIILNMAKFTTGLSNKLEINR